MKNKKGFAWFKTILLFVLIALFSILVVFIMQYIKNANKDNLNSFKSNLKMVAPTEYNPLDNVSNYYLFAYKVNNFITNSSTSSNPLEFETNTNIYYWDEMAANFYTYNDNYTPWGFGLNKINGSLDLAKDLYLLNQYVRDEGTYFNGSATATKSFAIAYNCNIPINYFNFTFNYNYLLTSGEITIRLLVMTDVGSMYYNFPINSTSKSFTFLSSNILSSLPQASKVLRFGFGFSQNANSSNANYYLPQSNGSASVTNGINYSRSTSVYLNYYNSLSQQEKNNLCYISFELGEIPQEYINAYNDGKRDGVNESLDLINNLNNDIYNLNNTINDLRNTINNQTLIINNLQDQLNQQSNFKGFFFTMADVPVRTVSNLLGFEVFGVNLFQFFIGILTALGCVWLIKKFI